MTKDIFLHKHCIKYVCLIFLMAFCFSTQAQYTQHIVVVYTKNKKLKGILIDADTANISLADRKKTFIVPTDSVVKVLVRKRKAGYVPFIITPTERNYDRYVNGEWVDEWGSKMPTLEEKIGMGFLMVFYNIAANLIVYPIYLINPNIAKFSLQENKKHEITSLNYYGRNYQQDPLRHVKELRALKEVSQEKD